MIRRPEAAVPLPSPEVHFDDEFRRRLGAFALRARAARERREGAGRARLFGSGLEFVGHRPYRAGEDLRLFDWQLFARLRRPFVRVARREASEHWAIALDTSASMGVGRPGKLQAAAEVATALAAGALALGATVELWTSGDPRHLRLRKAGDLSDWLERLEAVRAHGPLGLGALAREAGRFRAAGRLICLGDFLDLEPPDLAGLARRGRELLCAQVLAPEELAPGAAAGAVDLEAGGVEWVDAETAEHHAVELSAAALDAYDRRLSARLEAWRTFCARHRARFLSWPSTRPFEDVATELFGG